MDFLSTDPDSPIAHSDSAFDDGIDVEPDEQRPVGDATYEECVDGIYEIDTPDGPEFAAEPRDAEKTYEECLDGIREIDPLDEDASVDEEDPTYDECLDQIVEIDTLEDAAAGDGTFDGSLGDADEWESLDGAPRTLAPRTLATDPATYRECVDGLYEVEPAAEVVAAIPATAGGAYIALDTGEAVALTPQPLGHADQAADTDETDATLDDVLDEILDDVFDEDESGTTRRREVPAWAISLFAHSAIIVVLWTITYVVPSSFVPTILSETTYEEEVDYEFDAEIVDPIGNDSEVNRLTASLKTAQAIGESSVTPLDPILERTAAKLEVPRPDKVLEPPAHELADVVNRTGTTEHPGGVRGALDRLTLEIATTLRNDKAVVVWLFDRSPSVNARRQEIADRIENVYRQLGMIVPDEKRSLKTAVAAFGSTWTMLTDGAVDDYGEIVGAIRNIEAEPPAPIGTAGGGDENVFKAIREAAGRMHHYRSGALKRQVMLIVVTDEAGSDPWELDRTVLELRRKSIRAYVVGNAAPFGQKEVRIPVEYRGAMVTAVLEPGPETFLPELVRLPFWTVGTNDLRNMSSGFGPYALTRLCVETGGMFLVAEDTSGPRFDHVTMRNYAPDYSLPRRYVSNLARNPAKVALLRTIARFDPTIGQDPVATALTNAVLQESRVAWAHNQIRNIDIPTPGREFVADNDTILRRQITESQRPIAILIHQLRQIDLELMQGHHARDDIREPRWRANYDLAVGRLMALRARAEGYDRALAQMKSTPRPFAKRGSNRWRLVPDREIDTGALSRKLANAAREALSRVVDEHAGTPWAVLAERELGEPMGWRWEEYGVVRVTTGRRPAATPVNNRPPPPRLLIQPTPQRTQRQPTGPPPRPKPPTVIKF